MAEATMRGIDHIGITVPDIEVATKFLVDGLGAEVIYQLIGYGDPPLEAKDLENHTNCFAGTRITALRMIRVGHGPDIELFEMHADKQSLPREAAILVSSTWRCTPTIPRRR